MLWRDSIGLMWMNLGANRASCYGCCGKGMQFSGGRGAGAGRGGGQGMGSGSGVGGGRGQGVGMGGLGQ